MTIRAMHFFYEMLYVCVQVNSFFDHLLNTGFCDRSENLNINLSIESEKNFLFNSNLKVPRIFR